MYTGALDSNTGKQVFETLKKLSRDKLVIVVSHDRDFAEQYGDRIIELKDGKVISDVSKAQEKQQRLTDNVNTVGDVLCVQRGRDLTELDFEQIKAFVKRADRDVIIANSGKDIANFKKISRINDDGSKEVFGETISPTEKKYAPEDSRFIRSKLPIRHAVRIGSSGLKTKPFRLVFTVLLCTVAFVLFGLLSTMTFYDSHATLSQTLRDSNLDMIRIAKQYQVFEKLYEKGVLIDEYSSYLDGRFHPDDVSAYAAQYGSGAFGAVQTYVDVNATGASSYYNPRLSYFATISEDHPLIAKAIDGSSYPQQANEIWLSSYIGEVLVESTVYDADGNLLNLSAPRDIIGKKLQLGNVVYIVTGIFDSGVIDAKFEPLKEGSTDNHMLSYEFSSYLSEGLHQIAFLSAKGLEEYVQRYNGNNPFDGVLDNRYLMFADYFEEDGSITFEPMLSWSNLEYAALGAVASQIDTHYFAEGKTSLANGEVLVSANTLFSRISSMLWVEQNKLIDPQFYDSDYVNELTNQYNYEWDRAQTIVNGWWEDAVNGTAANTPAPNEPTYELYQRYRNHYAQNAEYNEKMSLYRELQEYCDALREGGRYEWPEDTKEGVLIPLTDAQWQEYLTALLDAFGDKEELFTAKYKIFSQENGAAVGGEKVSAIVGFYYVDSDSYLSPLLMTDADDAALYTEQLATMQYYWERETNYVEKEGSVFDSIFLPYDHSVEVTDQLISLYEARRSFGEESVRVVPRNSLMNNFESVDSMINGLSKVFLYVGLVLAVFAALLLSNFISVSISHKKREIGILRAVGARSSDVFKIFFSESFIIAAICTVLSIVGSAILCNVLNAEVSSMIGASLFVFGILSVLVLLGVALLTAVIATFLPVYNAAKKKPVDSIRSF